MIANTKKKKGKEKASTCFSRKRAICVFTRTQNFLSCEKHERLRTRTFEFPRSGIVVIEIN